jgi:ATP-dependent DNA helicase RecQ
VLRGSRGEKVLQRGHDRLPTFGACQGVPAGLLGNYIDQLVDAELLVRSDGEYPTLALGERATAVLKGTESARLWMPKQALAARGKRRRRDDGDRSTPARDLTAAEQGLFEALRQLRRGIANELAVPPFVVFSDATLDELARLRPTTPAAFLRVKGVVRRTLPRRDRAAWRAQRSARGGCQQSTAARAGGGARRRPGARRRARRGRCAVPRRRRHRRLRVADRPRDEHGGRLPV